MLVECCGLPSAGKSTIIAAISKEAKLADIEVFGPVELAHMPFQGREFIPRYVSATPQKLYGYRLAKFQELYGEFSTRFDELADRQVVTRALYYELCVAFMTLSEISKHRHVCSIADEGFVQRLVYLASRLYFREFGSKCEGENYTYFIKVIAEVIEIMPKPGLLLIFDIDAQTSIERSVRRRKLRFEKTNRAYDEKRQREIVISELGSLDELTVQRQISLDIFAIIQELGLNVKKIVASELSISEVSDFAKQIVGSYFIVPR